MFQEIAEGIHIQPSLLYQTQCVVVADRGSVTVIDPNYFPHEILAARELAERLAGESAERWVALTHSDFDHIAGVPWFEDFRVLTHAEWDDANEERARRAMQNFDAETYIPRARPLTGPIRRDRTIGQDGEAFLGFRAYGAQGHTRDGLVLHHLRTGTVIAGDYLSAVEFPFVYVSISAYRRTLERFGELFAKAPPRLLISQHGPVAYGAAAARSRLEESIAYIAGLAQAAREMAVAGQTPEALADATRTLWRGAIPDALHARHVENARIALREASAS